MKLWLDPTPVTIPVALRDSVGGHPVVAERLVRRGISTPDVARRFLSPAAYSPASPDDLPDMGRAVNRLHKAVRNHESILVWGDFDVDGQTSTALLVSALRDLGAKVSYHIPNRFTEGHSIHLPTLKILLDGGVDLLLTCDTGISAHEAVNYARSRHIDVVITDHHSLPETLPDAYAVVNPMRLPPGHALRELPGVGTAYQVIRALYGAKSSDHLLDLVAVGIVADVMVLVDDTRYWLQRGLDVLRNSTRPGLQAILTRAEIYQAELTETDIGFALAPRLNALGRLADANPAVELLTTTDTAIIAERVNELEGLNQKRRFLTRQVYEAAQKKIQEDDSLLKYAALVVSGEGWHTGVVGIVASRLVDEYGCPVIVLSENEGIASGSARSVAGCNFIEVIRSQAALLNTYGGHSMAAGLSLATEKVFEFRRGISQVVREVVGKAEIQPALQLDAYVNLADITLDLAEDIARLAPFGNGNPPLTLVVRDVQVKSRRTLGRRGDHLDLRLEDASGHEQRVIWWSGDIDSVPEGKFDLAYTVRPNVYKGKREALIEWLDARSVDGGLLVLGAAKSVWDVIDYRTHPDPLALLNQVKNSHEDVLVWGKGIPGMEGLDRYHLYPAKTLVVWSIPPDPLIWHSALNIVQPQTLILFGQPSPFDQPEPLLKYAGGLLKYAYRHKQGVVSASAIAGLTNQSEQTIRVCFKWFHTRSEMDLVPMSEDEYRIEMNSARMTERDKYSEQLKFLLNETIAYRQYWLKRSFQ